MTHFTNVEGNLVGLWNGTIADAMKAIPRLAPAAVGYCNPDTLTCHVSDSLDIMKPIRSVLAYAPLTISYRSSQPLNSVSDGALQQVIAEVSTLRGEVATLQGEVTNLRGEAITTVAAHDVKVRTLQGEVTTLRREVTTLRGEAITMVAAHDIEVRTLQGDVTALRGNLNTLLYGVDCLNNEVWLLKDATLPVLLVNLRTFIDVMLYGIGYNPNAQTRTSFINSHLVELGATLGLQPTSVQAFVSDYAQPDSAHITTSLALADAISRSSLPQSAKDVWRAIFKRTFQLTVEEQLENRGIVCEVNAMWSLAMVNRKRFTWKYNR